jgi:hypothetical protein
VATVVGCSWCLDFGTMPQRLAELDAELGWGGLIELTQMGPVLLEALDRRVHIAEPARFVTCHRWMFGLLASRAMVIAC